MTATISTVLPQRGNDSFVLAVPFRNADGSPRDVSGLTFRCRCIADTGAQIFAVSSGAGIGVTDAPGSASGSRDCVVIEVGAAAIQAATAGLAPRSMLRFDLRDDTGDTVPVAGFLRFEPGATPA